MSPLALLRVVSTALTRNILRSVLTALSVAMGVGLVVTVVGIGDGAREKVEKAAEAMGTNVFMIWPQSTMFGGVRTAAGSQARLTLDDARAVREEIDFVSNASGTIRLGNSQCVNGNRNCNTTAQGVETGFFEVRAWPIAEGQLFTEMDVQQARLVVVLGKKVADDLFTIATEMDDAGPPKRGSTPTTRVRENPIGQTIKIRGMPFKVLGVLTAKGQNAMGMDQDDVAFVPVTTALRRLGAMMSSTAPNAVGSISVAARSAALVEPAMEAVKELLARRHPSPSGTEEFAVRNFADIARQAAEQQRILQILLLAVATVSLLVGGVGIMNIMLVSVTERTREIGIRLAVGARAHHILSQFLFEALAISLVGGLTGVGLAYACTSVLSWALDWAAPVSIVAVLLAAGVSIATGAFFGLWPAMKASQLDPIEALRYE
jgi:putative ABC transport system permease protein